GRGDDRLQRQGRALGGRRALALAAAGTAPGRRPLRAEGALQRAARAADGRAALRQRRRDRRAAVAARTGAHAADPGAGQLRALTPWPRPRPDARAASRSRWRWAPAVRAGWR